jgi:lysophospholipase L1-like esterase
VQEPAGTVRLVARDPGRPGFFRSLPLPSRTEGSVIAAVLLITALFVGGSAWYASNRATPDFDPPAEAQRTEAGTDEPTPHAPVLAFYGDGYVSGTSQGGVGAAGWPAIVSARVEAEPPTVHAAPGAGYVAQAPTTGDNFATLAQKAPEPTADVTIVFGSRNDYFARPDAVYAGAAQTFTTILAAAPNTRLLVIGPAWTDAAVPHQLPRVRNAIQRAAADARATFIDPLDDEWFVGLPQLIGADVVNPTDAGHVYLADSIEPALRQVLADVPGVESTGSAAAAPTG